MTRQQVRGACDPSGRGASYVLCLADCFRLRVIVITGPDGRGQERRRHGLGRGDRQARSSPVTASRSIAASTSAAQNRRWRSGGASPIISSISSTRTRTSRRRRGRGSPGRPSPRSRHGGDGPSSWAARDCTSRPCFTDCSTAPPETTSYASRLEGIARREGGRHLHAVLGRVDACRGDGSRQGIGSDRTGPGGCAGLGVGGSPISRLSGIPVARATEAGSNARTRARPRSGRL